MQTNSYESWMRRPLSSAVCPTPDIWPDAIPPRLRRQLARHHHCAVHHAHVRDTLDREMMMNEQKSRILKMLEDKKITADEAMRLLDALDRTESRPTDRELKKKWLHIRVEKDGKQTVNLKLPLALLKFGFKFAPQHARGGHMRARLHAERAQAHAERSKERTERARERAERARTKVERKLHEKFGEDVELNLNGILSEAFADLEFPVPPVPPVQPFNVGGLDGILDGDFDLDLDKILEMAQDADFDGNILDVYDDDDDERVRITLE
ncbi:MAG: hypothetical protein ABIE42_04865 [Candidatus Eisenbacteria bacterium]